MLLNYDFDIVRSDTVVAMESQPRAVFRDAETRAAVLALPDQVRKWLAGAGFVDMLPVSDLPQGFYAPQDEPYRLQIMHRLMSKIKDVDPAKVSGDRWSVFMIADFVDAMALARPVPALQSDVETTPALPQIPGPFAGLRGKAAKEALAKAAPRGWHPKPNGIPFGMLALARRQGFLKLSLGTVFLYCAVLLYLNR